MKHIVENVSANATQMMVVLDFTDKKSQATLVMYIQSSICHGTALMKLVFKDYFSITKMGKQFING